MKSSHCRNFITVALIVVFAFGSIGAGAASATTETFYNANLGAGSSVSGTPHNSTYFVGAYTSNKNAYYCIYLYTGISWFYEKCAVFVTSNAESFPAQFGRGWLSNITHETVHYLAEARY
jgi:hypothetical protein